MKKLSLILCMILTGVIAVHAQEYKPCSTSEMWEQAVKKDPGAAIRYQQLLDFRKQYAKFARRTGGSGVLYTIPVVIHVIHEYGSENISKAQAQDAVDVLNESFQKLNNDTADVIPLFQPIFANCQVRFRLATIDPNGNCTDGITHTYSNLTESAGDNVKSLIDWDATQYFNIWVVRNIASGAAGYAYYPGISSSIDGVVILHNYTGRIGTNPGSNYNARSLTHETGHYLSLPHTWGSSNTPGVSSNCGIDDGIGDTPNTIGVANFSCNTAQSTCGAIDNVQNYMDYASCHKMFTEGQKSAMLAALNSSAGGRDNMVSPANLILTGTEDGHIAQQCKPVADFTNANYQLCAGNSVSFKDVSWNGDIIARTWIFNGGTPATDTASTVTVTYNTPGVYDVTLIAQTNGGADTLIRAGQVTVLPSTGSNAIPYAEGFETLTIPGNEWTVVNPNNNNAWAITTVAAATGLKSLRLVNQSGNSSGSIDDIITPSYDFTNSSNAQFSFKYAFAPKNVSDSSILKIFVSTNCGQTWLLRYNKTGPLIHTAAATTTSYIPAPADWHTDVIPLSSGTFTGKPSVRIRFEFINDLGNNIYLDDFNITGTVSVNEIAAAKHDFKAWPNPADDHLNIFLTRNEKAAVKIQLADMLGRVAESIETGTAAAGDFNYTIPVSRYNGMYILRVQVGDETIQYPVILNGAQ